MVSAQLLDSWAGTGSGSHDSFRPAVADRYPVASYAAVTQQTPPVAPNLTTFQVLVDDATWALIQADPDYGPAATLWSQQT